MRPFCPTRPSLYWKNWRSALERHVVEVFGARFRVRRRREAGELPEIVDEMALIVVAAFQREIRPIDLGSHAADGANRALKPLHAREGLGRETDLAPENLGEPPPGHTRSFHDPRNRAPWIAPDLPQRERHRRMPLHRPHRPAHQKTLRRREPGRCRWSREQLVAQRIGRASPQAIQSDLLIAQLIERHRQKREQAARFEMKAEDGKLRRRVDHGVLRPRSAQDHPAGLAERRTGLAVVQRHAVLRQIDHDLHRPIRQDALQRMRPRDALPQPQAFEKSIERRGRTAARQHLSLSSHNQGHNESTKPAELYETDFAEWTRQNAELLRSGRASEADLEHIAEEIEDMGKRERRSLHNHLVRLLEDLLKWRYQPERRGSSWARTIAVQRRAIARLIEENPSFRPAISDVVVHAYEDAVAVASAAIGRTAAEFPSAAHSKSRNCWTSASSPDTALHFTPNFVHPRAGISRRISFIHANSGCFARCSCALKFSPQEWPSAANIVIFSAPAASVILFCTAPAGA